MAKIKRGCSRPPQAKISIQKRLVTKNLPSWKKNFFFQINSFECSCTITVPTFRPWKWILRKLWAKESWGPTSPSPPVLRVSKKPSLIRVKRLPARSMMILWDSWRNQWPLINDQWPLRKKCPSMEFFIGRMRENTDHKKLHIWTLLLKFQGTIKKKWNFQQWSRKDHVEFPSVIVFHLRIYNGCHTSLWNIRS